MDDRPEVRSWRLLVEEAAWRRHPAPWAVTCELGGEGGVRGGCGRDSVAGCHAASRRCALSGQMAGGRRGRGAGGAQRLKCSAGEGGAWIQKPGGV